MGPVTALKLKNGKETVDEAANATAMADARPPGAFEVLRDARVCRRAALDDATEVLHGALQAETDGPTTDLACLLRRHRGRAAFPPGQPAQAGTAPYDEQLALDHFA